MQHALDVEVMLARFWVTKSGRKKPLGRPSGKGRIILK
jgi:hypothetical protein